MLLTFCLEKMKTELSDTVLYRTGPQDRDLCLNDFLEKMVSITFSGHIFCIACGKKTKTSFFQGFCYPCFQQSPFASECIIRPELCRAHLGEGRDVAWEQTHHNREHVVYLSNTTGLKVGVTSKSQVPTRWIDQGATEALIIAYTPNRYLAGCIESELKAHISDKTAWQRMLKLEHVAYDIIAKKEWLSDRLPDELYDYVVEDNTITRIHYPVLAYPTKVKSLNLDKIPEIKGRLMGIKGQYLIFEDGTVFNMRKHGGYEVSLRLGADL
jgi:hypothetical protein